MRTEQEIRGRISELDKMMISNMRQYSTGCINHDQFYDTYSNIWEEELTLYWTLGMQRKYAAVLLAGKCVGMSNDVMR